MNQYEIDSYYQKRSSEEKKKKKHEGLSTLIVHSIRFS